MIEGLALAFAIASFSPAAEQQPHFAEDFPLGVGYIAVLQILPDEDGFAKTCALSGVQKLADEALSMKVTPPDTYVLDACRKLHNGKWKVQRDESGNIQAQFYFCKYIESSPNTAYCDRRLGE